MADTLSLNATGMSLNSGPGLQDPVWSGALYQPAQPPAVPSLCAPTFHGRHGGNGVVLWLDGHASQQPAVRVPTGMTVSHAYGGLQQSPQNYNKLHIGYLARSANDLNSIAAIYYFVSNKNALSQNNINAYLSLQLSAGRMVYAVNPAAY
jgi:prepilin-type processing-associated H-X9-DG protein